MQYRSHAWLCLLIPQDGKVIAVDLSVWLMEAMHQMHLSAAFGHK